MPISTILNYYLPQPMPISMLASNEFFKIILFKIFLFLFISLFVVFSFRCDLLGILVGCKRLVGYRIMFC